MNKIVRQYQNTVVRRPQIADAAGKLIVRYGSEHITVRRIAEEIGVSEGAIYRHFKSKRDILLLMAEIAEENLLDDIQTSYQDDIAILDNLHNIFLKHIKRIASRRGFSFQVIAEIISFGDKKLNRKVTETINNYTGRIAGILSQGVKSGEIRPNTDIEAAASTFWGIIQGLVNTWTLSDYDFDLHQKAQPVWELFRRSIAA